MAPVKKLTKKEIGLQQRPWITPDILAAINERDKFYKEFLKEKGPDLKMEKHNKYKTKRNLVTSRLRKAKKDFYNAFLRKTKITLKRHGKVSGT